LCAVLILEGRSILAACSIRSSHTRAIPEAWFLGTWRCFKRHILVDTLGLLLHAIVHPADIQDRDGGILVMANLFGMFPFLKKLFADGGYQGPEFNQALARVLPDMFIIGQE
jgi:Transposase DDE domain